MKSVLFFQLAFTSLVYPSLILGYMGQAAYLSQHHNLDASYQIGFYIAVPGTPHYYMVGLFSHHTTLSEFQTFTSFCLYDECRECKMASASAGDLGVGGRQPGHHQRHVLHHQPEPVSELLPQGESRAHV